MTLNAGVSVGGGVVVERARDLLLAFESSATPPAAKPRRKGETAQKSLFD